MSQPICPKCGTVMCEQFDDVEVGSMTIATPNGEFECYRCGHFIPSDAVSGHKGTPRDVDAKNESLPQMTRDTGVELREATQAYFDGYMQDEAHSEEDCTCGREQHEAAKRVQRALATTSQISEPDSETADRDGWPEPLHSIPLEDLTVDALIDWLAYCANKNLFWGSIREEILRRTLATTSHSDEPHSETVKTAPKCRECGLPAELHDDPKQFIPAKASRIEQLEAIVTAAIPFLEYYVEHAGEQAGRLTGASDLIRRSRELQP